MIIEWILIGISSMSAHASIENKVPGIESKSISAKGESDITDGLTYKDLYRDYITTEQKWALLKRVRSMSPDFARKVYLSCLKSSDWILRSGGVQFLASLDPDVARAKAIEILKKDPALMVRSAALKVLKNIGLKNNKEALWSALSDSRNYHKGHSLWIRKDLAKILFDSTDVDDNEKWVSLLSDVDPEVLSFTVKALEKNNGMVVESEDESLDSKAEQLKEKYNFN